MKRYVRPCLLCLGKLSDLTMVVPYNAIFVSDRAVKENLADVDRRDVLERLSTIPITTWNYFGQSPSLRHIGPMGQDFRSAFKLGEDERHISVVDASGVALAAIQGLYQEGKAREAEIAELRRKNEALTRSLAALEDRLAQLDRFAADR